MIFGASVGPFLKKAFADKAYQTNIDRILSLLPRNPAESGMDAVVLGPKDFGRFKGPSLESALRHRHPDVSVIYVYRKDKEAELVGNHVKKVQLDKLTPESLRNAVEQLLDKKQIAGNVKSLVSEDDKWHHIGTDAAGQAERPKVEADLAEEGDAEPEACAVTVETSATEESGEPETGTWTLEQKIAELGDFADADFFKSILNKQELVNDLMTENRQFAELVKLIESLDDRIARIFQDASIPPEERFGQIRQIAIERAAALDAEHQMIARKLSSVLSAVVMSAESKAEKRIREIQDALDAVSDVRIMHGDQEQLQRLIDSRMHLQLDLMALSKSIIHTYQAMESGVKDIVEQLQDSGPTGHGFVNEMLKSAGEDVGLPKNLPAITHRLIGDLQNGQIKFSIVESKIKELLTLVFKLCEEDATIIDYQQKLIRLLQAQRVENVVVVDHAIKSMLSLFVGPADSGRTATALIWSGIVARRRNTLLIDLTGETKLPQYGVDTVPLDRFMNERLERPLLFVEGELAGEDDADRLIGELKTRLNYYGHIHLLLDARRPELVNRLAKSALAVHWVTDCSPRATDELKKAVEAFSVDNVAMKAVLIDPPIKPLHMLSAIGLDPFVTKTIIVPKVNAVKACSLERAIPYENPDVVSIYEEAFR